MFQLQDKTALVTGAGSGIGASIAQLFAQAGAHVYVADVNEENGREVVARIKAENGVGTFLSLDVRDENAWRAAREQVGSERGRLDVLVNNAGIGHVGTMLKTRGDDLDRLYEVNVRGVFNGCATFLPDMIERGSGNIINMASIGGVLAIRDRLAYCTTKFAVVGLTKSLALDHAHQGVRANCICPGRVETPFVQARLQEYADPVAARAEMSATQAVGRMATPDEIASAALYLASDASAFVTGTAFLIDGGWSAGK